METLYNGFTLEIPEGAFPLSTDSMVLAHFARLPKNARVLDLGSTHRPRLQPAPRATASTASAPCSRAACPGPCFPFALHTILFKLKTKRNLKFTLRNT